MGVSWASAAIGKTLMSKPAKVEVKFHLPPPAGERKLGRKTVYWTHEEPTLARILTSTLYPQKSS